jgi:hypothetical protein
MERIMRRKTIDKLISKHFSELGRKSWEVRKKKIIKVGLATKQPKNKLNKQHGQHSKQRDDGKK